MNNEEWRMKDEDFEDVERTFIDPEEIAVLGLL